MLSLFFRNLFFTVIHPGLVTIFVPYWILGPDRIVIQSFWVYHYSGILLFLVGGSLLLDSIVKFAVKGFGTLSPIDPTRKLVINGFYHYSRNPMYVGAVLMLVGESIYFQHGVLWIYTLGIFIIFNLFVMLVEEPRLRRDFGADYEGYCKRVRRWL